MRRWIIGLVSHAAALAIGFALGVYLLPVLTAPAAPAPAALAAAAADARFTGTFNRDLPGSDFLHWGEDTVSLSARRIAHDGWLALVLGTGPAPATEAFKAGLVEVFAQCQSPWQHAFLEGPVFDAAGNLWVVGIYGGHTSKITPDG